MDTIDITRDINLLRKEKVQDRTQPISPLYNAWAEIDLDLVRYNVSLIQSQLKEGTKLLAVVKANAYGHGLKEVSRIVLESGAQWLGVTSITEALELRRFYPFVRILILSAGMYDHSELIVKHNLTPIICSRQMAELLNKAGEASGKKVKVHIKIDTGMGRLGAWYEKALEFVIYVSKLPFIEIEGICTHFASAGSRAVDIKYTKEQLQNFSTVLDSAEKHGIIIPLKHIANTGAALLMKDAQFDMVRAGIGLYGLLPSSDFSFPFELKPILALKSRVAFVKEVNPGRTISYGRTYTVNKKTKIATIPIGYSNGYFRNLSNKGQVLIRGKRASVVGIVTMDQIMVDVGDISDVSVGDEVVLIGLQGNDEITASEVAKWAGTISYEVLCKLNIPRVYFSTS